MIRFLINFTKSNKDKREGKDGPTGRDVGSFSDNDETLLLLLKDIKGF